MKVSPLLAVAVMAVAMVAAPLTVVAVSGDTSSADHAPHDTGRPAWAGPDREALPPGIAKRKDGHGIPPGLVKKHGGKALPPGLAKQKKGHGHGKALGHHER